MLKLLSAVLVGVALGWVLWTGWTALRLRSELVSASQTAQDLRAALVDGDQAEAEQQLATLQDQAESAAQRTRSPTWRVAAHLPAVGDDVTAVNAVSEALLTLSARGLPPIVAASADLDAGSFAPRNGRPPVAQIEALQQPVAQAEQAFAQAHDELSGVDTDGLLSQVAGPYDDLRTQVEDASSTLVTARRAVDVLPGMLGIDGPRNYLLLFQNNAEARSTGGMPGAMSVVEADNGRIRMTAQASSADFGELDEPVLPLTAQEREIFGKNLGTYIQDANFTPDFARTAELAAARWQQRFDQQVDGVLSVDPVALSYLLEATGPVTVDGITLTSDNVVEELLNKTYLRLSDPVAQDVFFQQVARAVFDQVTQGGSDSSALLHALARGASEHRLLVHGLHSDEQDRLAGTSVAGEFPTADSGTASDRPQVTVSINDATGSKMSYYLDYDVKVIATACEKDAQQLTGTLRIVSNAPADAASLPDYITGGGIYGVDKGTQIVVADLFGPIDGTITSVKLDGKPGGLPTKQYAGRPVVQVPLYFASGDSVVVHWTMTTGPGQTGDTDVFVTPGVQPQDESSVAPSACG